MNCREFVEFLMAYLDGTLDAREREIFEAHMVDCPSCETYLDTYRDTIRLGRQCLCDPDGPVHDDVPEELVAAILAARAQPGSPARHAGWLSQLAARLADTLRRR
ncbi:MAG: zf-HC2 domain-containing protein [Myxococcales bacterium]|nr:zf-HC2 domain-containing protein [Myxococcales bacterium]MDH5305907.1 zf-HC2 domain-containing protein [Myxococcales bacterium]MDH5566892.1 zf-HC2 domain-containing protein [Myxococcales bacterium]